VTTTVISLNGRKAEFGPHLEHAPDGLVYVGRAQTMGCWRLPAHPLANPFSLKEYGTPEAAVAAYIRHLLDRPNLLAAAAQLRGRTLACWCAPQLCHAHAIAWYADSLDSAQLAKRADDLEAGAGLAEAALFARLAGEPDPEDVSLDEELNIVRAHNRYGQEELRRRIDEARERDGRGEE